MNSLALYSENSSEKSKTEDLVDTEFYNREIFSGYTQALSRKKIIVEMKSSQHMTDLLVNYLAVVDGEQRAHVDRGNALRKWVICGEHESHSHRDGRGQFFQVKKLQERIDELERVVEMLLIDDSPLANESARHYSKSNNKRIIYILNNLKNRKKYVMLNRMVLEMVDVTESPDTLFTMGAMLSDVENSKLKCSAIKAIEEKLSRIHPDHYLK